MSESIIRMLLKHIGDVSEEIIEIEKQLDIESTIDKEELLEQKLDLENKLYELEQDLMEYMI